MSASHQREAAIFDAAMELPPARRSDYLDKACGADAALRRRVESLLKACESQSVFLDSPAREIPGAGTAGLPASEKPGETIGRYKLLEQIGEGGCGVVYVAEQAEPVRRRVALKIIKLGMDTKSVIARFEAERQALALMDHPNIAKVFDAGATEAGRPYFVMELVRGMKITEFCDEKKLGTRARLDLFIQVCQAIQHAHQKGIIHRDIKPSNILVTMNDGIAVPKVIDFGIAKATSGQQLTDKTIYTAFDQFIGTPAYMSPEQAVLTSLDIDTRSDIYALGVLLYELLTGKTPFDAKELFAIGLDEMRRTIREQEPPRPSTRLSTLPGQELSTAAHRRSLDAPKLVSELRGDLDWIVMKTLEKDRARRYETANGLAADIQRHLNNEPVVACPPSRVYRLRKTVQRNKLAFAAGSAVATALLVGVIMSAWQAHRAKDERDSAQAVLTFFREKILAAGRPEGQEGGLGKDVTLRKAVDAAEKEITESFKNRPLVEAAIRHTLSESYGYLGEPTLAIQHAERALDLRRQHLGPEHIETVKSMSQLGVAYRVARKYREAIPIFEESFKLWKSKRGLDQPDTLRSMGNLGVAYLNADKFDQALPIFEELLKLQRAKLEPEHPDTLRTMHNLGSAYRAAGKLDQALPHLKEALKLRTAKLAPSHPDTLESMNNLALVLFKTGKIEEAIVLYDEALKLQTAKLGPEHLDTLMTMNNLAGAYARREDFDRAIPLLEESVKWRIPRLGLDNLQTWQGIYNLAEAYHSAGKFAESEKMFAEILPPHAAIPPQALRVLRLRAGYRARRLQFAEAAADMAKVVETKPDDHKAWHELAPLLVASSQLDAYREHCRKSLERFGNSTDPNTAERIAKDCLILPDSGVDLAVIVKMADAAAAVTNRSATPWFQFVKGLAEYRQGGFAGAVEWLSKVLAAPQQNAERNVEAYMVLAMARYQLKQAHEARAAFVRGAEIEQTKLPKLESGDIGGNWLDWIIAHALMREAKALIEGAPETKAETR